jgi:hypothetical protein
MDFYPLFKAMYGLKQREGLPLDRHLTLIKITPKPWATGLLLVQ